MQSFCTYNLAQPTPKFLHLIWHWRRAQGFALDKDFHWRSTTVLAYKPMLIFVNLYISI